MKMLETTDGSKTQVHIRKNKMSKSILLIGNSDIKENEHFGDIIDSFDNVARFNRFEINGYEKYLGEKTTHYILNKNLFLNACWFKRRLRFEDIKRYVITEADKTIVRENKTIDNVTYILGKDSEPMKKYYGLFKEIMKNADKDYEKLPSYKPETGILAILYFLNKFETVYLHNFDFGKTTHYYGKKNNISDVPNKKHAWEYSKQLVKHFEKQGKICFLKSNTEITKND